MGLIDLTSEVLFEVKADTSDIKAQLAELDGQEKEFAAARLEEAEERNESIQGLIENIGKISLALVAAKEIGDIVWDGYNEGIKEARLESTAAGVDIEALSKAAGGLKTNMELLEFAAKANSSAFHNSQEDMETAEKAIRALEARGIPAQQAFDAVTNAMDNLKTRGLQSVGIYVDTTAQKFDENGQVLGTYSEKVQQHEKVMESLKAVALEVSDGQDRVGDSMKRSQVSLSDSWAEIKKSLGELVAAMQPFIEALSKVLGLVAKIAKEAGAGDGGPGIFDRAVGFVSGTSGLQDAAGALATSQYGSSATLGAGGAFNNAIIAGYRQQQNVAQAQAAAQRGQGTTNDIDMGGAEMNVSGDVKAARKADAQAYADKLAQQLLASAYMEAGGDNANLPSLHPDMVTTRKGVSTAIKPNDQTSLGFASSSVKPGDTNTLTPASSGLDAGNSQAIIDSIQKAAEAEQALNFKQGETLLSKTFGKTGEFDLYKKGFEALSGAVGSMYDAIVTGSEPASVAIRKAIGSSVEAVGKQMAIESLKEAAYAIGDLAIGNAAGASAHATAAAEFAAGAIAAGLVASELGAGGGSTPNSSSSSKSGGSSGSSATAPNGKPTTGNGTGNGNPVIVIGDSFANDTARMRAVKSQNYVNAALGVTSAGTSS